MSSRSAHTLNAKLPGLYITVPVRLQSIPNYLRRTLDRPPLHSVNANMALWVSRAQVELEEPVVHVGAGPNNEIWYPGTDVKEPAASSLERRCTYHEKGSTSLNQQTYQTCRRLPPIVVYPFNRQQLHRLVAIVLHTNGAQSLAPNDSENLHNDAVLVSKVYLQRQTRISTAKS